ncbi:MAG TPA: DUF1905 domain-containing protein [Sphingomicrobium sp.]|nr:DUF1905 domain-containing protein [Sphingomicrobium sp.]
MIAVSSLVWIWRGEAAGRWYFVTVPDEQSADIKAHALGAPRGFGSVRVSAAIGDTRWQTSVFPLNSGGYLLPIKADVRKKAGIGAGDEVKVELDLL